MGVLGLVIAVIVPAANTHDNAAGIARLDQAAERIGGTVEKALVGQGFKKQDADLLRLPRLLGDDSRHGPPPHRREHPHLAR